MESKKTRPHRGWSWNALLVCSLGFSLVVTLPGRELMASGKKPSEGESLIGAPAPEWNNHDWINSRPLKLSELKGKVVLLRFFMESTCPMCSTTAPSLNQFYSAYKDRGLMVVGMYTPKPRPAHHPVSAVRKYVEDYKFEFPVALDNEWATLRAFWLDRLSSPAFTSVSFLIDRKGIIRFIHPGGEYSATSTDKTSRNDFTEIKKMIEKLLTE